MRCIAVLRLVSSLAEATFKALFWIFTGATIFQVIRVKMATIKSLNRLLFVEKGLESQINTSIYKLNVCTIGAISEMSEVVMP